MAMLSGFALAATVWGIIAYNELATEYRLAVLEIDAFNVALAKADIEVDHSGHAHKGDKP